MATTADEFQRRLGGLKADIVRQGLRVRILAEEAFEAVFSPDASALSRLNALEDEVDRVDVEIEREAVALLTDATEIGSRLADADLRLVLTIVKINNELERIADAGVQTAELGRQLSQREARCPATLRVMTNSVVGILRDAIQAIEAGTPELARVVLESDDAVEAFKDTLVREAERMVAGGSIGAGSAFAMVEIATACQFIAEHAVNIAEQLLYYHTGTIVRHSDGRWQEVRLEESE
ncbi:MAG: PhoU domain-containing protein [Planctomycetota bacterium]